MNIIMFLLACLLTVQLQALAQRYPEPEFSNEIYYFKKTDAQLSRLEKGLTKVQSKTKLGGMGGGENAYNLEGSHSSVRLKQGQLSFIFFLGSGTTSSPEADSARKANGMDLSSYGNPLEMLTDPSTTTSLFNMQVENGGRKITLQSYSGMKLLGKSKKESVKYSFSIKKVRNGYYELVVNKLLEKGEYAFLVTDMHMAMDGSSKLFAFGID